MECQTSKQMNNMYILHWNHISKVNLMPLRNKQKSLFKNQEPYT